MAHRFDLNKIPVLDQPKCLARRDWKTLRVDRNVLRARYNNNLEVPADWQGVVHHVITYEPDGTRRMEQEWIKWDHGVVTCIYDSRMPTGESSGTTGESSGTKGESSGTTA